MKLRYVAVAALACAVAAGPQAWGKLLWQAGCPALAIPLIGDASARAAALYEAGRYTQADAAFAAIGRSVTYDRGLTLAATGDYALSVAYFDAVLFADRYDTDARHNRDTVAALVPPVIGEAMGHGRIEAILSEAGLTTGVFDPDALDQPIVKHPYDLQRRAAKRPVTGQRTAAADSAWRESLEDAPAAYLKARLAAEMERRREAGTAFREEVDRW